MSTRFLSPLVGLVLLASPALAQVPCGSFTSTPVPVDPGWWEAELEDVTTLPDGSAWASGHYKTYEPYQPIETFTLAMFWDGQGWNQVPTPSPSAYPGGTKAYLHAVGAVAPDDVWAAGERHGDAGGLSVGAWIMVQHWDGSSWELVPVPEPPGGVSINFSGTRVEDIVALAEDDVWFGGQWGEPNDVGSVTWRPLAMHWDGSELEIFPTPAPYEDFYGFRIASMSAVASDDIWAACSRLTAGGHAEQFVVLHWDGNSWDQVDIDNGGGMRVLYTVEAIAADDVWIFGEDQWPAGPEDVFALHYDGSGWTEITGAPPARGAFALASDAIYTGAGYNIGHGISLFDGQRSTVVEDFPGLNVHVFEGERGVGCSGWIVGREMVGGKKPFAARLEPNGGGARPRRIRGRSGTVGTPGGTQGTPTLSVDGGQRLGDAVTLSLVGGPADSASRIVVGFSTVDLPLSGGMLAPSPALVRAGPRTGADGGWTLPVTWPASLPAGTDLWIQAWVADPTLPHGWRASSPLHATMP